LLGNLRLSRIGGLRHLRAPAIAISRKTKKSTYICKFFGFEHWFMHFRRSHKQVVPFANRKLELHNLMGISLG